MDDISDIERMTLYEYDLRMIARNLRNVDTEKNIHLQAWANWNVQAMKKSGKKKVPVFKKFSDFFNFEKEEKKAWGRTEESHGLLNAFLKRKKEG